MSGITGAEVLADRERLLRAIPLGEALHGIITTDRADGVLYVLSRYEDLEWWLPKSKSPESAADNSRKLDIARIKGKQLRSEAKIVLCRTIYGEDSLKNGSIKNIFDKLVLWLNWLHDQGINSPTSST
tara:strand:- start:23 stop:406 length:384 start_codon:yes stop_codon:yes gene_type:complete